MATTISRRWHCLRLAVPLSLLLAQALPGTAAAYTPDSPEVKQMVAKAVGFLKRSRVEDDRFGARSLVGMALVKAGAKPDHPKVLEAVEEIRTKLEGIPGGGEDNIVYGLGMSIIFLVNADPKKYRSEVEALLEYLRSLQKPHGGWGYLARPTGDTSMTQYGILSIWEAKYAGFEVPEDAIVRATNWLLKTQDPSGAFGYQGTVAPGRSLVQQEGVRLSMGVAGLGSIYMCADLLGLEHPNQKTRGLPTGLELVKQSADEQQKYPGLSQAALETQSRGNRWTKTNYRISVESQPGTLGDWTYYYMYSLERYWSFREWAEGDSGNNARWYDDGVNYLTKQQAKDGSWDAESACKVWVDTSFGILFLVRSMRKSIERARNFDGGILVGGRGLPKDSDAVVVRDGRVMSLPEVETVEKVLSAVEQSGDSDRFQTIEALGYIPSEAATPLIDKHAEKLRELAGDASPDARLAAVRALAKRRNMDDVPVLIYGLTDPDANVVLAARDGLRRISRKLHGFGLSDDFSDPQRRAAVARWKEWYLSIRPNAEFFD